MSGEVVEQKSESHMMTEAEVKKMSNGELANILARHGDAATMMLMKDTGLFFREAAERLRKFTPQGDSVEFKQKEVEDLMQVMGNGLQAMVVMKTMLGLAKDAMKKMRGVIGEWCYEECTLCGDGENFNPSDARKCGRKIPEVIRDCDNVLGMIAKMEEEEAKAKAEAGTEK